jgi:nucleoid-associated protein YgaU
MPIPLSSRYHGEQVYDAPAPDGGVRPVIAMRLASATAPRPENAFNHLVGGGETLESIAWRHYGASTLWWRIADANPLIFPTDLRSGVPVLVPGGAAVGRVERSRRF